jgi:hypothetical protein
MATAVGNFNPLPADVAALVRGMRFSPVRSFFSLVALRFVAISVSFLHFRNRLVGGRSHLEKIAR